MNNLTANSIVSLFETTKEQRISFVAQIINNLQSGMISPLQLHLQVKGMEEVVKSILADKNYKDEILREAEKHGNSFKYMNAEWTIRETGVEYDYESCKDPIMAALAEQMAELTLKIKDRQVFLKSIPREGVTMVDEDTGEVHHIKPPNKKGTTSVTVKLK